MSSDHANGCEIPWRRLSEERESKRPAESGGPREVGEVAVRLSGGWPGRKRRWHTWRMALGFGGVRGWKRVVDKRR
jgi:hypothetical protein